MRSTAAESASRGHARVFHARRNNEVLQALALKNSLPPQIAFTSTAHRSWITRWLIREADAIISSTGGRIHSGWGRYHLPARSSERYRTAKTAPLSGNSWAYPANMASAYWAGSPSKNRYSDRAALPARSVPDFTIVVCGETTAGHQIP